MSVTDDQIKNVQLILPKLTSVNDRQFYFGKQKLIVVSLCG